MRVATIREPTGDTALSAAALATHRFLLRFALAGGSIFAWIFVFQYFYIVEPDILHAFTRTVLLYGLSQLVIVLVTPLSAQLLRLGARRSLTEGVLLASTAFIMLAATIQGVWGGGYAGAGMAAFALLFGFYRAFYWLPYDAEARGAGGVRTSMWRELAVSLAPAFVGFIILAEGVPAAWLLYGVAALAILSLFPLVRLRDVYESYPWSYRETFAEYTSRENRRVVEDSIFDGVYGASLLLLWPLAVFLILGWSYGLLGIVFSITLLIAVLARGGIRKSIRKLNLHESRTVTTLLAVSPWLLRLGVASPLGVVLVDSYFYTTAPNRAGMDPAIFEQAGDAGFFVDKYTALKEMGLALGRFLVCVIAAGLTLTVGLPLALIGCFLLAAFLSLWSSRQ